MNLIERQPLLATIVAFILGLFIGLVVLGWGLWPVEWTDAAPQHLAQSDKDAYLRNVADLYAFDGNQDKVRQSLAAWPNADAAAAVCDLRNRSTDPAEQQRLEAIAMVVNGTDCATLAASGVTTEEGGRNLTPILLLGLLLVVFVGASLFVLQRRNAMLDDAGMDGGAVAMPEAAPVGGDQEIATIPLAQFNSNYTFGRDTYDDSFSIENSGGEFLGECGVGISESIGTDAPKNVTAFEVWLFDKNDIRTVTKVVMSDHAFFDEALKAKLAPKGEPVLAREGDVIVLETASLIINAEIKEMSYGEGTLPPQSFFQSFTVELSAWAKEGDYEADIQGRVDELLDY